MDSNATNPTPVLTPSEAEDLIVEASSLPSGTWSRIAHVLRKVAQAKEEPQDEGAFVAGTLPLSVGQKVLVECTIAVDLHSWQNTDKSSEYVSDDAPLVSVPGALGHPNKTLRVHPHKIRRAQRLPDDTTLDLRRCESLESEINTFRGRINYRTSDVHALDDLLARAQTCAVGYSELLKSVTESVPNREEPGKVEACKLPSSDDVLLIVQLLRYDDRKPLDDDPDLQRQWVEMMGRFPGKNSVEIAADFLVQLLSSESFDRNGSHAAGEYVGYREEAEAMTNLPDCPMCHKPVTGKCKLVGCDSYHTASPGAHKTKFLGELRFVQFAHYAPHGPTIMVYTQSDFDAQDAPGPIGFIPLSEIVEHCDGLASVQVQPQDEQRPRIQADGSIAQATDDDTDPSAILCLGCRKWFEAKCPDCEPIVQDDKHHARTVCMNCGKTLAEHAAYCHPVKQSPGECQSMSYAPVTIAQAKSRVEITDYMVERACDVFCGVDRAKGGHHSFCCDGIEDARTMRAALEAALNG